MKTVYILLCYFVSTSLWGQVGIAQIDSAKNVLDSIELRFSNRHIKYADAALGLALLYYQADSNSVEKEQLSLKALSLYRKLKGVDDPVYLKALRSLPSQKATRFHLQLNVWDAANSYGKKSKIYGEELLKLGRYYLDIGAQEGHDSCLYAMQILMETCNAEDFEKISNQFAAKYPKIALLIQQQLKLEAFMNRHYEDIEAVVAAARPNSVPYEEALRTLSATVLKYKEADLAAMQLYSAYEGLKKCLEYYEKTVNIESAAYKNVLKTMPPEMQLFYKLEKDYLNALATHNTDSEDFLKLFKAFLREIGDVSAAGSFTLYDVQTVFHAVELDLEKYHGGNRSPVYLKVREMSDVWNANAFTLSIEYQQQAVEEVKEAYGADSRFYAEALFDYALLQIDYYDYASAIDNLVIAMQVFKKLDEAKYFDNNSDPVLRSRTFSALQSDSLPDTLLYPLYLKKLPEKWAVFVENELVVSGQMFRSSTADETALALLHAADAYLAAHILDLRAYDYCKQAASIDSLRQKSVPGIGIDTLKYLLLKYPTELPFAMRSVLVDFYSVKELKTLLDPALAALGYQELGLDSILYYKLESIYADAYYHNDTMQDSEWLAYRLYNKILDRFENTEGAGSDYESLIDRIVQQIKDKNRWSVEMAGSIFQRQLKLLGQRIDGGQIRYRKALFAYAEWLYDNDQYMAAEPLYKQLKSMLENISEKEKAGYPLGELYYNLARIYRKTGRYQAAFQAYKSSIAQATRNENYLLTIECLDDVGLIMYELERYEQAADFYKSGLELFQIFEAAGELNRRTQKADAALFVKLLRHRARLYLAEDNPDMAEIAYNEVLQVIKNSKLLSLDKDYSLQRDLALLYDKMGDDKKALRYYKNAIKNLQDKGELAEVYQNLAMFYLNRGLRDSAAQSFEKALQIDLQQLDENYRNLPEESRLLFLKSIENRIENFNRYVLENEDTTFYELLLNAQLKIKGLSLETSGNIRNVINDSENVELKDLYNEMQLLRKKLADASLLSPTELKNKGIDLGKLNMAIQEKEEAITRLSQGLRHYFDRENRQIDFKKLTEILPENAAAIDFLILPSQETFGEKVYYAMFSSPKLKEPKIVKLCTENQLQSVLEPEINPRNFNYITDDSESQYLYELIFEPLEDDLKGIKTIHLCPVGLLCKVAFATLQPTPGRGQRLMDSYELHYHSAMRDLLGNRAVYADSSAVKKQRIALVGGVHFSLDKSDILQIAKTRRLNPRTVAILSATERGKPITSGFESDAVATFNYLPGTLSELQAIASLFEKRAWELEILKGANALEEQVLALSARNPTILHIATHGFFFPAPASNDAAIEEENSAESDLETHLAHLENPLFRSGLALSGINRVWEGGKQLPELADGIFTAYEVAGMSLFDTELVVLSACETGRGEIDNNEGILGLQRAFKMAGVEKLILSLWKVPDAQTAELMMLFYQFYLGGDSVQQAFEKAQKEMRIRYKNPYYWAAFILVE